MKYGDKITDDINKEWYILAESSDGLYWLADKTLGSEWTKYDNLKCVNRNQLHNLYKPKSKFVKLSFVSYKKIKQVIQLSIFDI